jgi:hypothetical protein
MTSEQNGDRSEGHASTFRADYDRYDRRRRNSSENVNSIAIDKTTAVILGAIGSAAIAVAIAGGTALVQKVDDTAREVDKGRTERIAAFGEVSKNISIVETKLSQLITQIAQLEMRIERTTSHDLEIRDKKIEIMEKDIDKLRDALSEVARDSKRR